MTNQNRPAFRKPWTHGAKAYIEADTFAALHEGMKRMRKVQIVHMPNSGEAGDAECASCGGRLRDASPKDAMGHGHIDTYSVWHWLPKQKAAYGEHYYCSWGSLMNRMFDLADRGLLH